MAASLLQHAALTRLALLLLMAASCHWIPEHNPGDDVLRFDPRLPAQGSDADGWCYCRVGQACDGAATRQRPGASDVRIRAETSRGLVGDGDCAIRLNAIPSRFLAATYRFILTPMTKWDAARFLHLAVDPSRRDPEHLACQPAEDSHSSDNHRDMDDRDSRCEANAFRVSEEAHAFFPMFPMCVRFVANVLDQFSDQYGCIPKHFLPPSYEGTTVLAALLWNMTCFLLTTWALNDATQSILANHTGRNTNATATLARRVTLIFIYNPASVFFLTSYSESTFAALNFVGHAVYLRMRTRSRYAWWILAVPFWMAASYTRSNGSINAVFLMLEAVAILMSGTRYGATRRTLHTSLDTMVHLLGAALVMYPIRLHDVQGWNRHCGSMAALQANAQDRAPSQHSMPEWCTGNDIHSFSLYKHVQREHWDVGAFRYYEWKQIPNFLLAAPVLIASFLGVCLWIRQSMFQFHRIHPLPRTRSPLDATRWGVSWGMQALRLSDIQTRANLPTKKDDDVARDDDMALICMPAMLPYYAILFAIALVGLIIAHVQISTRLICSSSPAMFWCLAWLSLRQRIAGLRIIQCYCGLYIALGIILHVNFLPWT